MKKISLLILVFLCSCNRNTENQYFNCIENNDIQLSQPVEGEWLFSHKEKGQSFEQYEKTKHIVPTIDANIIYVKPIGNFNSLQKKQIELLREYLEIYWSQK